MNVIHRGNRVLLELDARKNVTSGGIALPDTVEVEGPTLGTIVAVGSLAPPMKLSAAETMINVPRELQVGDRVIVGRFEMLKVNDEPTESGKDLFLVSGDGIIAIVNEDVQLGADIPISTDVQLGADGSDGVLVK